jgi:hypothetical protein
MQCERRSCGILVLTKAPVDPTPRSAMYRRVGRRPRQPAIAYDEMPMSETSYPDTCTTSRLSAPTRTPSARSSPSAVFRPHGGRPRPRATTLTVWAQWSCVRTQHRGPVDDGVRVRLYESTYRIFLCTQSRSSLEASTRAAGRAQLSRPLIHHHPPPPTLAWKSPPALSGSPPARRRRLELR